MILTSYRLDLYNTKLISSCLNKQTLTVLAVTTIITQTPQEAEEVTEEALVAGQAGAVEEITEIVLHLPNHCLKENYEMGAYISSPSLKGCINPHNSRKFMTLCPSYAQTRVSNISTM